MQVLLEDKRSLAVRLVDGGQLLKFTSPQAETIVKEIGTIISKWQNEQPVSYMYMHTCRVCTCKYSEVT